MTVIVASELKAVLGTELKIGKIDIGLLNRIIIDDVLMNDQAGKEMLKVTRLSAKFEIWPLLRGKITISSVQLFGFNITLNKLNPESPPNFKFVLDAFASKDSIKKDLNLDLRINSVLIRRGKLSFDVLSEPETPGRFNPKHIKLHNIIANVSLKALSNDSINGYIKRLSLDEQSGFELQKLSLKILANQKNLSLENFSVVLPNTSVSMDTIRMRYNGLSAFENITDSVHFSGRLLPSYVTLRDISCFVPALGNFREKLYLDMELDGTVDRLNCPRLEIRAGNDVQIRGDVAFQDLSEGNDAYVFGNLSHFNINRSGIDFLVRNFVRNYTRTPDVLKRLGDLSFRGEISGYFNDLVTYGVFRTELGVMNTDLKISSNKDKGSFSSSGAVKATDFELGKLLGKEDLLGKISFNLDVSGTKYENLYPSVNLKGLISSIEFSKYEYQNIELDGKYAHGGFDGRIALNDKNGTVLLNGSFNPVKEVPEFNFHADIRNVYPHNLNLTKNYVDSEFSLKLDANFLGGSIDDMIGEINVDSVSFSGPDKNYFLDNLNIKATQKNDGEKQLVLSSKFINAVVKGNYSYQTVPVSVIKTVERYIPSLLSLNKELKEPDNNFSFDIHIYNTDILSEVFNIPLTIYTHSTIKGYFNDVANKLRIEGYFPSFKYGNRWFESGMILCENPSEVFKCQVRASNRVKDTALNVALNAQAQNDELKAAVHWGNNAEVTYSGTLSTVTNFFKTAGENPILQADIKIEPTKVVLNDTIWNIHPSQVKVDSGRVYVDNFLFKHQDQFLRINGKLTKEPKDTVKVELKDINIGYVFDIAQLKSVDFTGMASGTLFVNQTMKSPELNTTLFVKGFSFNQALLGDMDIFGKWDKDQEGIFLDAKIREQDIARTSVKGHIFIKKKGLDLNIDADGTNIKFLEHYMKSIASNVHGRVHGHVRFFGGFKSLNLQGDVLTNASLKINVLNTAFSIRDSIHLRPTEIQFNNMTIFDPEDHRGKLNGYLRHEHFKNLSYRFQMEADNMLVFNTKEDPDMPFYGTVYGTGDVLLNGNPSRLDVVAAMSTNRNTNFVYITGATTSAASNQFITFIDKTPKRDVRDSIFITNDFMRAEPEEDNTPLDIRLNLQIDATPEGTMKIVMDPVSGDYISGKGTGNIRMEYFNKGDVKMFGNYTIDQGIYKFSLQEVIRKDFIIKSGSTIAFNGDPMAAILDIQASYTVNSASLSDLGISEALTTQNNVKVNCMMNLAGNLTRPTLKFDIELPNANEEDRDIVKSAISTEEQMNMQILYLLGIGKFYTYDYGNNTGQSSNAMTSVLSSTLSGQLNNMLSHVINSNNWNFGTTLSTGDKGWTDMEVEGMLSGQLLNNRLLINGNFGYRDNPTATTNFVGDFDIEYLLTKSGDIRLKGYNQTNDRYYTKTTLTTQGVGIVYKKDFNTWRDIFLRRKKHDKMISPSDTVKVDSISIPESMKKRNRE